jgi:hypothetical protein
MEGRHALIVKWYLAANQNIKHDAKAPDIHFGSGIGTSLEKFWGGEVQTPAKGFKIAPRCEKIGEAEVDNFDVASFANEYVFDLEIPMYYAVAMAVVKGTGDLTTEFTGLLLLQFPMRNDVIQHLTAIDKFEEHIPMVICSDNILEAAYVRVMK